MYISGNLGLGTTKNTQKFDVNDNVRIRTINTNVSAHPNKLAIADTDGVLKTLPGSKEMTIDEYKIIDIFATDKSIKLKPLGIGETIGFVHLSDNSNSWERFSFDGSK